MAKNRILIIDDDLDILETMGSLLMTGNMIFPMPV